MQSVNEISRQSPVITVSELNRRTREIVEGSLPLLWVSGEVSNFTRAASGHCYFSLKDERAQVRCVLFRHKAARLEFAPENGAQVEVCALPTIYEARGEFQLGVETMRRAGLGALYEAFERLRRKLAAEGLFDEERKRELPVFPSVVGIVTSPAAAALRDVLTTLRRRMPSIPVVLYPAPVQGEGAGEKLAEAVRTASSRAEVDVLIVCRGGGSMEDLWEFNSEALVRAVAQCSMPVVCGVGHDTDYTLIDFVADVRAPTPTAAAAMATPDREELLAQLSDTADALALAGRRLIEDQMQRVDYLGKRLVHPGQRIEARLDQLSHLAARLLHAQRSQQTSLLLRLDALRSELRSQRPDLARWRGHCEDLALRLRNGGRRLLDNKRRVLEALTAHLDHLNPEAVLSRGYSIVTREDGLIVRDSAELEIGATVDLRLARGRAGARIENKD
ncbi:MAG: exodeoxyribonuclease VII large subunit [Betaproteobacteria bacterium]|nr:MAG: exodeoxyribonuclease VII large subunit [Betaproteobacteria bacterium]